MRQENKPSDSATLSARKVAYRLVGLQAGGVVIIGLCWWVRGSLDAISVILGGAASILPSLYFVRRLFTTTHARAAKKIVTTFFLGEFLKLMSSGLLVVLGMRFLPVAPLPFLVGFVVAQFGFWFAPFIPNFTRPKEKRRG